MTNQLTSGNRAPAFTLKNADGASVSLGDYRGGDVIVYFYPKAATPGCTTEACDFRDNLNSLASAGYSVIGVSADPVDAIASFAEDNSLNFPLLSDPGAETAKAYGAWGEKQIGGTTHIGVLRSTVVIDPKGIVSRAEYNVDAAGHVAALRASLGIDG
ncbi:thioredoxin-dependent thiol peroxidase [Humibacter antri]